MANDILDIRKMYTLGMPGGDPSVGANRDPYGQLFEPPPISSPEVNPVDELRSTYVPETEASERFKQLLSQYPEREDPSFARRITSGLLGIGTMNRAGGGIDTQDKVLQGPNDRKLSDWEKKVRPAEVASSQENQRNVNSRTLAGLEMRDKQVAETQRITEEKNKAKAESDRIRNEAARYKALGWTVKEAGSEIVAVAPPSPENPSGAYKVLGSSNKMDEIDREELRAGAAQKRAETMAAGATERANITAATSEKAGGQVFVDSKTGLPNVINPRADVPTQTPVENASPIQRVPGTKGPSTGQDLARVRGMSKEALDLIKKDFLVIPDTKKNPNAVPAINPKIKLAAGLRNWDPRQLAPESPQRAAIRAQTRLKSLLTLSLIGEMKEQSKTGATGFGQLTGRELDVLEDAASKLDWALDDATLTEELVRIVEKLEKIMQPGEGESNVSTLQLSAKFRQNKVTGEKQVSTDGGKTWKPYVGK